MVEKGLLVAHTPCFLAPRYMAPDATLPLISYFTGRTMNFMLQVLLGPWCMGGRRRLGGPLNGEKEEERRGQGGHGWGMGERGMGERPVVFREAVVNGKGIPLGYSLGKQ